MKHSTPYKRHQGLKHKTSHYSPNGIDTIEECEECSMRFLHQAQHHHAILLPFKLQSYEHGFSGKV